jgi:hypothetical protein
MSPPLARRTVPMFVLALLPLVATAGRPLQTEDAGVLDRGACEIEGFRARATAEGISARETRLQAGCGVGFGSQVALAVSSTRVDAERERGLSLVGKTGLWKAPGDDAPALTFAWGLDSTSSPASAARRGRWRWSTAASTSACRWRRWPNSSATTARPRAGTSRCG